MDGSELYGRTIKVAAAKPQKDANEGLGSKTAIWEQVRVNCILLSVALRLTQHRITGGLSGQVRSQRRGPTSSRRSPGRGQPPARPDAGIGTARRCRAQARIMYTITMATKIMKDHERPFCRNTPSKIHLAEPAMYTRSGTGHVFRCAQLHFLSASNLSERIQAARIQMKNLESHSRSIKKHNDCTFSARGSRGCCGRDGESCRS
jgi:hypothetical protein